MILKKIIKKLLAPTMAISLATGAMFNNSCSFLDIDPYITDMFTLDSIFTKQEYAEQFLNNMYSYLGDYSSSRPNSAASKKTMPYTMISDEAVSGYKRLTGSQYQALWSNNEITPENLGQFDRWDDFYKGIRQCNTFLANINQCREVSEIRRQEWIGETYFIKASCYFELMLAWGPVPIMPDQVQSFDTPIDELMVERSTWDECSAYVEGLLNQAIALLPNERTDASEFGRATRNAARAVLSRLTLYTASPLFNGQNGEFASWRNNAGTPYLNPAFDMGKWAKAAAMAKILVDEKPNDLYTVPKMDNTPSGPLPADEMADFPEGAGGIDHLHSYQDMFNGECVQPSSNKELLFTIQRADINEFSRYMDPGMLNSYGGFCMSQRIVDEYRMADGRNIHDASTEYPYSSSGYTEKDSVWSGSRNTNGFTLLANTRKWYANREPRFYATVAFNNSFYASTSTPPDKVVDDKVAKYYSDAISGRDFVLSRTGTMGEEYPMTGYYCRKFNHYEDSWITNGRRKLKYGINYRMAEVYLNYVEAMNELDKSYTVGDVTVFRDMDEMRRCFNLIRHRAGQPGITAAEVADPATMRTLIEHERLIEMMWEGRRYFDNRRNKRAVYYENLDVNGLDVSAKSSERERFYTVIKATERNYLYKVFTTRQTFWPIPKHEIDKNYNLDQMLGY